MENLFSRFWKTQFEKNKNKIGYQSLEDLETKLKLFTKMVSPFEMNGDIGGSLWAVGFVDSDLLLPKDIYWTPNQKLNTDLLLLLILKSVAIKELELKYKFDDRERIAPRLYILSKMPIINSWLDQQFPQFFEFEKQSYLQLEAYLPRKRDIILEYWKQQISSRSMDWDLKSENKLKVLMGQQKRNDSAPFFLHACVPLPYREFNIAASGSNASSGRTSADQKTQKKRRQKEFVEESDLSKQGPANPVLHSFEKMETADDYDGGRRVESGDDELDEHSNALDELELNRHTSVGEASSLYQQDSPQFKSQSANLEQNLPTLAHQYSEWNFRENRYLRSFCTVFPILPIAQPESENFKNDVLNKHKVLIAEWKAKINSIVNTPRWKNRLIEGSEIDLDSMIRLKPELKLFSGRPRIYSEKRKVENDISLLILADVSYSTDTWINGEKVIDIIKNSIAVASFVFENVLDKVSVAIASSQTRKHIEYKELKKFNEPWIHFFQRSYEIMPHQYTRLGPAIRHANKLLSLENSTKPVLVLITDGKPTDLDPYEGSYGQQDVRKALEEAKNKGINVVTLTISDFDPASLKRTFERPCSIKNPDDFCRETFQFIWKMCFKSR
jgi:nitric oxide reductase NorD protein